MNFTFCQACCASGAPPKFIRAFLKNIHEDVLAKFYGCGFPFSNGMEGCTVVDLGCGAGRDVYVLSQMVGPKGHVIGVDMTAEQIEVIIAISISAKFTFLKSHS